jgi:hypothetical protein
MKWFVNWLWLSFLAYLILFTFTGIAAHIIYIAFITHHLYTHVGIAIISTIIMWRHTHEK